METSSEQKRPGTGQMKHSYTPDPDGKGPKPGLRSRLEDVLHGGLRHGTIRLLRKVGALAKLGKAVPDPPPLPPMRLSGRQSPLHRKNSLYCMYAASRRHTYRLWSAAENAYDFRIVICRSGSGSRGSMREAPPAMIVKNHKVESNSDFISRAVFHRSPVTARWGHSHSLPL